MGHGRRVGGLSPSQALLRLCDPRDPALAELARLAVAEAERATLRELVDVERVTDHLLSALRALFESPRAESPNVERWLREGIAEWRDQHRKDERTIRDWLPGDLEAAGRTLLSEPWSPDERLVLRLLDQPAVRRLVHVTLEEALTRFQKRLRSLDSTGLGALGARAARRGKGLLGGLGGLTENLVGAVAEELENAVQQKISDYVDSATGDAIRGAAKYLADPQHAASFGAMRASAAAVLLDIPLSQWIQESEGIDLDKAAATLRDAVLAELNRETARERVRVPLQALVDRYGDHSLRSGLNELGFQESGLAELWRAAALEYVEPRLRALIHSDGFKAWWDDLFSDAR